MKDAFIFDALRTPRGKGKASGALYELKPIQLLATLLNQLKDRNQLDTSVVDDLILGCVSPTDDQGADIAKAGLLYAGWDDRVAGVQINRFCGSGLDAVNLAAMKIRSTWDDVVIAGGIECMSRVKMGSDGGALLYDPNVINKIPYIPQGISADLIATIEGFDRDTVDRYALQSQQRAAAAQTAAHFDRSIVPIYDPNGLLILDKDEYLRPQTNIEGLSNLRSAFAKLGELGFDSLALRKYPFLEKIQHVHTAGNSSGIVDGAALVLLGNEESGKKMNLKPRAKILSAATVGSEPTIMLQGPTPATHKALQKAGMNASDIDLWEMNEAFAAAVLKFQRDLDINDEILNVNGGAIALGHPLGATGAMLLGTLLDEMERRDLSTGLVTLCIGGGMGVATIIERV
ncbi:MAG: acetyl-CoA C-acetyltransferase [Saprospiraceae bacterium]